LTIGVALRASAWKLAAPVFWVCASAVQAIEPSTSAAAAKVIASLRIQSSPSLTNNGGPKIFNAPAWPPRHRRPPEPAVLVRARHRARRLQQGAHQHRIGPQTQCEPGGQWRPKPRHAVSWIGVALRAWACRLAAPCCWVWALADSAIEPNAKAAAASAIVSFLIAPFLLFVVAAKA
jgi:hypothetical protein